MFIEVLQNTPDDINVIFSDFFFHYDDCGKIIKRLK
jgi:hypothetical protein